MWIRIFIRVLIFIPMFKFEELSFKKQFLGNSRLQRFIYYYLLFIAKCFDVSNVILMKSLEKEGENLSREP